MKKTLLNLFFFLSGFYSVSYSQPCSVTVTGARCIKDTLIAKGTGGQLAILAWKRFDYTYYTADAVLPPPSVVVAGGNGSGSTANQLSLPGGGITVDKNGNVYLADRFNHRVQKWAPGAVTGVTVAGGNGQGSAANQLSNPMDVAVDKNGNVYVADNSNARIQKWAPGAISGVTVAGGNGPGSGPQQLFGPRGVFVDNQGNIYIADAFNYRIQKWAPNATAGTTVAGGNGYGTNANQFHFPMDVCLDLAGNIYVADADPDHAELHRVQKWAPGAVTGVTVAGGNGIGNAPNQIGYLLGIAVDTFGAVYVADNGLEGAAKGRIQKWGAGAATGVNVVGGTQAGWDPLVYPAGVFVNKQGDIFVLQSVSNPAVKKYTPVYGTINKKFAPTDAGPYTVTATFTNGCVAQSAEKMVWAPPTELYLNSASKGGRGNLCAGGKDTFLVYKADTITNYTWKVPKKITVVADKNDTLIVNVPPGISAATLIVSATNFCGTSGDTIRLVGRPLMPGAISGPRKVLVNQTGVAFSVPDLGFTYKWTVPGDATITAGQGSASILVNWGTAPGTITVFATNNCGTSTPGRTKLVAIIASGFANNEGIVNQETSSAATKSSLPDNAPLIYPNPAVNSTTLVLHADKQARHVIEIRDVAGKALLLKEVTLSAGVNNINLDVHRFAKGVYFVTVTNAAKQKTSFKLVKQ